MAQRYTTAVPPTSGLAVSARDVDGPAGAR
jgi:hypothetical protein